MTLRELISNSGASQPLRLHSTNSPIIIRLNNLFTAAHPLLNQKSHRLSLSFLADYNALLLHFLNPNQSR